MVIPGGVTEVADSDEESMTSTPLAGAANKPPAMASAPPQELQDAIQGVSCTHQALGQDVGSTAPQRTTVLGVDACGASTGVDAPTDQADVKLRGAVALLGANMGSPEFTPRTAHVTITTRSDDSGLKGVDRSASQHSDNIYPSDNVVHRSQVLDTRDATRIPAAATNSSDPSAQDLTGSVSISVPSNDRTDSRPEPGPSEIQDQNSRMEGGDCRPDTTLQESMASTQQVNPFTSRVQMIQEKPKVQSTTLEEASQPGESASQGLSTSDTALESQQQPGMGASPTIARTNPSKTPQEITLSELKVQKASLLASLRNLPAIRVLMEEMASSDTGANGECEEPTEADIMKAANSIVKQHIKLLHEYNELKDVGQGLMGLIADQRGVRIVEIQEEFGMDAKD